MIGPRYLDLINAFKRMGNLNGRDKFSIFQESKESIIYDYTPCSIFFIKEDPLNKIFIHKTPQKSNIYQLC